MKHYKNGINIRHSKCKMEKKIECFKEPQESDVSVLCPIVWSGGCGCVTPLMTDHIRALKNAPVML